MGATLHNADCRSVMADIANRPDADKPVLICTDPPYRIQSGGKSRNGSMSGIFAPGNYDNSGGIVTVNMGWDEMARLFYAALPETGVLVSMCEARNAVDACLAFRDAGLKHCTTWIWDKRAHHPGPCTRYGMKDTENILVWRKGGFRCPSKTARGHSQIYQTPGFKKIAGHPTEKPISLMKAMIEAWTQPGDLVCDPFIGGGATGVAAVCMDRRFLGCELEQNWFEISKYRIEQSQARGTDAAAPSKQPDLLQGSG